MSVLKIINNLYLIVLNDNLLCVVVAALYALNIALRK
ncbi:MAG: hypothetical protein ACI892_001144 [Marinobacter maritimus]|jgi:hypothetical protein